MVGLPEVDLADVQQGRQLGNGSLHPEERLFGGKKAVLALSMALALLVCYAFGTAWFMIVYAKGSGPIGLLMNVLSTCAFVVPAAIFYRAKRKFSSAVIGLLMGIVCMAIIMVLWNWLITPLYMGIPREEVVSMLLPVFLPFNLVMGAMNAAITLLIYNPIVTALRKANLVPKSSSTAPKKKGLSLGVTLISLFIIVSLVLVVLAWTEII